MIPSAPGKRFSEDTKVTDMLYGCYAKAEAGKNFDAELTAIADRYQQIIDGLGLSLDLSGEFEEIGRRFAAKEGKDYAASRGEYLNGKVMAEYLGYEFADPAEGIYFYEDGTLQCRKNKRGTGSQIKTDRKSRNSRILWRI